MPHLQDLQGPQATTRPPIRLRDRASSSSPGRTWWIVHPQTSGPAGKTEPWSARRPHCSWKTGRKPPPEGHRVALPAAARARRRGSNKLTLQTGWATSANTVLWWTGERCRASPPLGTERDHDRCGMRGWKRGERVEGVAFAIRYLALAVGWGLTGTP